MSGLVASLAKPGGNVTGLSSFGAQLVAKRLELLKQVVPQIGLVAVLWEPGGLGEGTEADMLKEADTAARTLGVRLQFAKAVPTDLDAAFATMKRERVDAVTMLPSPRLFAGPRRLVDLASKNRLPTVYPWREIVDVGGLMSYGANFADLYRRAATYVHKILEGAKPADVPVEQPTKYELVINLKTARELGLSVPQTLITFADEVIE